MNYDDYTDKDIFIFLMTCSKRSLGNFLLAQYAEDQKLKKDLLLAIEDRIEKVVKARRRIDLANLIRDHGEEIISRLLSDMPQAVPQKIMTVLKEKKA